MTAPRPLYGQDPYSQDPYADPYGQPQYPPQQHYGPHGGYTPPPVQRPVKRRRIWPWFLLGIVLVPVMIVVGCTAFLGTAATAIKDQSKGGTVAIGQTFTYKDGTAVTIADLRAFTPTNSYEVQAGEAAFETTMTIANGSKNELVALATADVTIGSTQAQRIYGDGADVPTAPLPPGQQLVTKVRFKAKRGTTGDLRIAVRASFNDAVYFTGKID